MMMMSRVERCTMFRQIGANQPDTQQTNFLAGERRFYWYQKTFPYKPTILGTPNPFGGFHKWEYPKMDGLFQNQKNNGWLRGTPIIPFMETPIWRSKFLAGWGLLCPFGPDVAPSLTTATPTSWPPPVGRLGGKTTAQGLHRCEKMAGLMGFQWDFMGY